MLGPRRFSRRNSMESARNHRSQKLVRTAGAALRRVGAPASGPLSCRYGADVTAKLNDLSGLATESELIDQITQLARLTRQ